MPSAEDNSSVLLPGSSSGNVVASSHGDCNSTTRNDSATMKPVSGQWATSTNGHGVNNSASYLNNHNGQFRDEARLNRNINLSSSGVGNMNGQQTGLCSSYSNATTFSSSNHGCHDDSMTHNNSSIIPAPSPSTYFPQNGNSLEQRNFCQEQKLEQQQQHLVSSNQIVESHFEHLAINKNRRPPLSQQRFDYRPSLISLDPNELTRPLFCYTLQLGVTMLGSGKGCVKPPDIVLHGSNVAPQHAFVERLVNEAVLHPISEETSVDGRQIKGPTALRSGALISIGDSYFFRFSDGSTAANPQPSPQQFQMQSGNSHGADQYYVDESPYAVVNNRAKGNASCSVGDVNKNLTIGETFKSSSYFTYPTTSASSSEDVSRNRTTPSNNKPLPSLLEDFSQSARSSSVSTTTTTSSSSSRPSTTSDPVDHLLSETISSDSFISSSNKTPKTYRDGLESENFVNKLARFEYLAHTQHSRPPPVLPFPTVNSVLYGDGQCYSDNSDSNSKNKGRIKEHDHNHKDSAAVPSSSTSKLVSSNMSARPSVSFNRSDHGYNSHLFYTNHAHGETFSLNSNTTVVSTPESSSGSYSSGGTTNTDRHTYRRGGNVTFFDDYANLGAVNATPSPASMDYDEDSSLINQYSSSIPSPDSLSSISNHRPYFASACNSSSVNSTANSSRLACQGSPASANSTGVSSSPNSSSHKSHMSCVGESETMTGDTLLELRRKQSRFSPQNKVEPECLGLDEILAMCEEYEEQIAKELEEKKATVTPTSASTTAHKTSITAEAIKSPNGTSVRSPNGSSTPTSPHYYSNGRIKTNGSLPRDPARKAFNLSITPGAHHQSPNSHVLSPKESPTASFTSTSRISDDFHSMTSSMTVSPCSLGSYSFTTDGKASSSTSPTSSTCTSFTTSTPIPFANPSSSNNSISSNNNNNTSFGPRAPTPGTSIVVCQSAKSPYENLGGSSQLNTNELNGNSKSIYQDQQQLKVPLSPSGIRTTPDYHRKPILLNSSDLTNNSIGFSSTTPTNNTLCNGAHQTGPTKPALLSSSFSSSKVVGDCQSADKTPHQQKSKLSVSFSNSVQEYYDGKDDDDENDDDSEEERNDDSETSSDNGYDENGLDKICTGHVVAPIDEPSYTTAIKTVSPSESRSQLRINGPESATKPVAGVTGTVTTTRPSILRTISTEVQVHVQSGNKKGGSSICSGGGNEDDDNSDSSCCFNRNSSNNDNGSSGDHNSATSGRTLSNSNNHNDSHGQTNLMCSNIGQNANVPTSDSNSSNTPTNGILKCRELNELGVIDAVMLGRGSTASNSNSSSNMSNKMVCDDNDEAKKCAVALAPPPTTATTTTTAAALSSRSLPSSTCVNQDLTQSSNNGNNINNNNNSAGTTQNFANAKVSGTTSLSTSSASASSSTTVVVGSGPGNPKTMSTSSSSSTPFGKVHNGYLELPKYSINENEGRLAVVKNEIMELEQQEMEALREMEIEKALLLGEEKSFESQTESDKTELVDLKERLAQIDDSNRKWRALSLERITELKTKLMSSEKELQRLEKLHEEFCGSTDEETVLLERLKFQMELVEGDRKAFEDAEFHHMEEEVNKEAQREELTKTLADIGRKLLSRQFQLEQLRSHNRISINSAAKEIHTLEKRRQELIRQLRMLQQYLNSERQSESTTENGAIDVVSDENRNMDLEEKLKALHIVLENDGDNAMHIERVKSRSPIDPTLGAIMGPKTFETLREIERHREYLLNEQGAQMLEEERARVRELQKRVQDAVREEWEASRKSRNNQCHSLNSVGSEDSGHTISDTPTDSTGSGSGTDESNDIKSGALSISTTDGSLSCTKDEAVSATGERENLVNGQNSYELCQQMRQKTKEMAAAYEETRPLSDGSAYDDNSIVIRRDKHRIQNRPLTRYLPVRGDEDQFDLRAHIESSGHQLELCPHVIVTKTTAKGFLSKLGSRFHNWNKRWFVFDRETRTLTYYADKNEKKSKPRGGVHFQAIEDVYVDHLHSVKSPNPKLTFCVKTFNRVFHLLAPSPEAMRIWVDIIFTGAEGYQEFKCAA